MKIVQVMLKNTEKNETLTTWVESRPELRPGVFITLKDFKPETRWRVEQIFSGEHDATEFDFHRKWDNNNYDEHKGLGV